MSWSITQQVVTLQLTGWKCVFDLAQPQLGIRVRPEGSETAWQLLQVFPSSSHACQIEDSFVRGADLMVRYGQSDTDMFSFQIDFRAVPPSALGPFACGLDMWLSVQTQLLDSHPTLEVRSHVPSGQWLAVDNQGQPALDDSLATLSCHTSSGSVAIMVHPSDQCQSELLGTADLSSSRVRLFGNFMEKGVIRRGRVRCLFGHSTIKANDLARAYDHFAISPLPLTT